MRQAAIAATLLLVGFAGIEAVLVRAQSPLIRLQWVMGRAETSPLYEKWNSFSRITVNGDPTQAMIPQGWGLSAVFRPDHGVRQLWLLLDSTAGTSASWCPWR